MQSRSFCVKFTCSHVAVGFLSVLRFSATVQRYTVGFIGYTEIVQCMRVCLCNRLTDWLPVQVFIEIAKRGEFKCICDQLWFLLIMSIYFRGWYKPCKTMYEFSLADMSCQCMLNQLESVINCLVVLQMSNLMWKILYIDRLVNQNYCWLSFLLQTSLYFQLNETFAASYT